MVNLISSWDLAHLTGEPHSLIRVRNLQTVLGVGTDAWGRPNKDQPVLISASVSLRQPFSSASETDTVTNSTVHYGMLSKAILRACKEFVKLHATVDVPMFLYTLVQYLQAFLTGAPGSSMEQREGRKSEGSEAVLWGQRMRMLEIEVMLPKASLLGSGVSLKGAFVYDGMGNGTSKGPSAHSMVLRLHELRVPTLIGVNSNERLAKQMVVASVEMEKWDRVGDGYCQLEELVVKTIEESTFETLEALSSHLSSNIIKHFLVPQFSPEIRQEYLEGERNHNHQRIRISLEKPTAVMFADAPVIEVLVDSDPSKSQAVRKIWESTERPTNPPFPLKGSLSGWEKEQESVKK